MPPDLPLIPHLSQYVGPWACEERAFMEGLAHVRTPELLAAHVAAFRAAPVEIGTYQVTNGGVAVIDVVGTMTKYGSSLSAMQGGTVGLRRAVRSAATNDNVQAIVLRIDSPGGTVSGTDDLAEDVAAAAAAKPLVAFIEDLGASAAYWVASQARRVVANRSAQVGSIGVYAVVDDMSGNFAQQGIKTHVIRAGKFKGVGVEGTEVTPEQLTELQRIVDGINEDFVQAVARGRKLSVAAVREMADGRVHKAADAKKLGLIDAIETFQAVVASLEESKTPRRTGARTMAETQAATLEEIKLFCPGADEKFIIAQLERKATADQARSNWTEELLRRNAAMKADLEAKEKARVEAEAKAAEAAKAVKKPGVQPLGAGKESRDGGDAIEEWQAAVAAKVKAGLRRDAAVRAVVHENPDLHAAYLAEANAGRRKTA